MEVKFSGHNSGPDPNIDATNLVQNDLSFRSDVSGKIFAGVQEPKLLGKSSTKLRTSRDVLLTVIESYVSNETITVSDVHFLLNLSRSTAGRAIRGLETCRIIYRQSDDIDRRRQTLSLSINSAEIVEQVLLNYADKPDGDGRRSLDGAPSDDAFEFVDDPVEGGGQEDIAAEAKLLMYQHGASLAGIGHMVWDFANDRCLFASREVAEIFGLPMAEFQSASSSTKMFVDLLHPVERGKFRRFIERIRNGGTETKITYHIGGGEIAEARYLLHIIDRLPAADASDRLELHIFRDITLEISGVMSLRQAKEEAERTSKLRGDFIAHFSHELRTPLNAIIGFSQMLMGEVFGAHVHDKYREYSDDIHNSGLHLLEIVNDVLDLSKLEAGKMRMETEPVAIGEVINGCTRMIMRQAQERRIAISTDVKRELPMLIADELRLRQILINLLSNAVKFTGHDGRIDVIADCEADGAVSIEIRDNGVGIPASEIDKVLEPFGQASTADRAGDKQGTGLGLTLVKFLAELHDAEFSLHSALDQGTVARVRFPPERSVVSH